MRGLKILFFFLTIFLLTRISIAQQSCTECHDDKAKGKVVHAATESCESCHESVAEPHPQEGVKTFKLPDDMAGTCATCHDAMTTKKTVHSPVKEGECTTCHDPHVSDQPKLLVQSIQELCVTCHSDKTEFKHIHGPAGAGDCVTCHTPHESDTKALLKAEGDQICFTCHSDIQDTLKKKNIHSALESGCTSCHNAHGSEFPKLLAAEGTEVCYQCHSDVGESLEKAISVHTPLKTANSCVSCHSPHASDHPKLLAAETKNVCANCHKNVITKDMAVVHAPVQEGDCASCHAPHGSQHPRLLTQSFPTTKYVAYTETEYELCFTCHDRDLLSFPDTEFATNFRNGKRNLHYLHANKKDKGRSCVFCHNVHGSRNPKLIEQDVPFGNWKLPLNFKKTETGGSCSPGCHKPYTYDRKITAATSGQ